MPIIIIFHKWDPFAFYGNHDPLRERKLLLHKYEIKKLYGKVNEKGFSLIPLKIYFQSGKAKITIALARGKRKYDKREAIRQRDEQRDLERSKKDYWIIEITNNKQFPMTEIQKSKQCVGLEGLGQPTSP